MGINYIYLLGIIIIITTTTIMRVIIMKVKEFGSRITKVKKKGKAVPVTGRGGP
jgi:hypothetical protein